MLKDHKRVAMGGCQGSVQKPCLARVTGGSVRGVVALGWAVMGEGVREVGRGEGAKGVGEREEAGLRRCDENRKFRSRSLNMVCCLWVQA